LATEPRFIVCDKPVSALGVSVQAAVVNLLADLRDEFGLSYLFISHDLAVVGQLSDRIAVMYRGRLVETGQAADVLTPPFHPYTRALLASVAHEAPPDLGEMGIAVTGGCAFRARCRHRMAVCDDVAPPLRPVSATHSIACHLEVLPGAAPTLPPARATHHATV
jgi:peptide/nickel transport system ATP-binding protein